MCRVCVFSTLSVVYCVDVHMLCCVCVCVCLIWLCFASFPSGHSPILANCNCKSMTLRRIKDTVPEKMEAAVRNSHRKSLQTPQPICHPSLSLSRHPASLFTIPTAVACHHLRLTSLHLSSSIRPNLLSKLPPGKYFLRMDRIFQREI